MDCNQALVKTDKVDTLTKKIIHAYDRLEDFVLVTMFGGMVAVIFYQVIMRYVFNNSSVWSEELGRFLFVWITWIGISIGARRLEHIKVMMLVDKMPFKASRAVNIFAEFVVIAVCAITAYYSYSLMLSQNHVSFAAIKISMTWGYLAVFLGCVIMCLRCLLIAYDNLRELREGPKQIEEEGGES